MKCKIVLWLCAICIMFSIYRLGTIPGDGEFYSKEDATLIIKEKEVSEGYDDRVYTSYQFYFKFCDGRYIKKELTLYEFKTFVIGEDYIITYRNDKPDYTGWYFLLLVFSSFISFFIYMNWDEFTNKDKTDREYF